MTRTAADDLPPESRLALRALAAGVPLDSLPGLCRASGEAVRKQLRTAVRAFGGDPPPPSAGDAALLAALEPALGAARAAPGRAPATACLAPDVARALAREELDGPLFLAEAEHVADCPRCLGAVLALRSRPDAAPAARATRSPWPAVVGALMGIGAALAYLLLR